MNAPRDNWSAAEVEERVRANTGSAAVAAGLLILYGFFRLARPTGTDWFSLANLVLYYTICGGGIAMAAVAVWSAIGHVVALLADGIVSCMIGAAMIVTGFILVVASGDLFNALFVVFGLMFLSAGVRNGRDYFRMGPTYHADPREAETIDGFGSVLGGGEDTPSHNATGHDPWGGSGPPHAPEVVDEVVDVPSSPVRKRAMRSTGTRFATYDDPIELPEATDEFTLPVPLDQTDPFADQTVPLADQAAPSADQIGADSPPIGDQTPPDGADAPPTGGDSPPGGFLADLADDEPPPRL